MRVIVCGGRNYRDRPSVFAALDRLHAERGIDFMLQGGADGADYLAWQWAEARGIPCGSYPAQWDEHGKRAGPIRNQEMIDEGKPDGVVAFPGGRGTADMVSRAEAAGLKVWFPCGKALPLPHRSVAANLAPDEWGTDADLDSAMRSACRELGRGECPQAGSEFCEHECPFREGNW